MNADLRKTKQIEYKEQWIIPYGYYSETVTIMGPYFGLKEFVHETKDAFYIDSDGVPPTPAERETISNATIDDTNGK